MTFTELHGFVLPVCWFSLFCTARLSDGSALEVSRSRLDGGPPGPEARGLLSFLEVAANHITHPGRTRFLRRGIRPLKFIANILRLIVSSNGVLRTALIVPAIYGSAPQCVTFRACGDGERPEAGDRIDGSLGFAAGVASRADVRRGAPSA